MHANPPTARTGANRQRTSGLANMVNNFRIAEKVSGIVALLALVMILLVVMSIQSVRLQAEYRRVLASSTIAAINVERVNGLIYASVMDSRGIYLSSEPATVRRFSDELLK